MKAGTVWSGVNREITQREGSRYMIASWSMGTKKSRPRFKTIL